MRAGRWIAACQGVGLDGAGRQADFEVSRCEIGRDLCRGQLDNYFAGAASVSFHRPGSLNLNAAFSRPVCSLDPIYLWIRTPGIIGDFPGSAAFTPRSARHFAVRFVVRPFQLSAQRRRAHYVCELFSRRPSSGTSAIGSGAKLTLTALPVSGSFGQSLTGQ